MRALKLIGAVVTFVATLTLPSSAFPGPTITGFSPSVGPPGTSVIISGSGFTGATSVQFDGTVAQFSVVSDDQISTSVPAGASSGAVQVTSPLGSDTTEDPFTVTPAKPNLVLILTDDQRFDEMTHLPAVQSALADKGVTFTNGFVVNPQCCPSRTTILTGKYSHGTDVYTNKPPHGGFETFKGEDGTTIATVLHDAGYRTALIGKYLNGYVKADSKYIPPGWDRWVAALGQTSVYYNYQLSVNGARKRYGSGPNDYSTDVLAGYAVKFIASVPSDQPLFLYFAPHAPHEPTIPPPRYENACQDLQPLRRPNYNEQDVSDKPAYVRKTPLLTAQEKADLDSRHVRDCQALLATDDAVNQIIDKLRNKDRLSNTLIVFASDNGFLLGEHRLSAKVAPYEESVRVPIIARYDPLTKKQPSVSRDLVLNLDFAETFAGAAGLSMPGAEGKSLLPVLANPAAPVRDDFLIEHWGDSVGSDAPPYCAVRSERYSYVEYSTGEEELYDLRDDPYQLQNQAGNPDFHDIKQSMHARMVQLCQPPPPDFNP